MLGPTGVGAGVGDGLTVTVGDGDGVAVDGIAVTVGARVEVGVLVPVFDTGVDAGDVGAGVTVDVGIDVGIDVVGIVLVATALSIAAGDDTLSDCAEFSQAIPAEIAIAISAATTR